MAKLFVISGPTGAGLREIVGAVLDTRRDIGNVTPVTARKRKAGERERPGGIRERIETPDRVAEFRREARRGGHISSPLSQSASAS